MTNDAREFISYLQNNGVIITNMSDKEEEAYRQEWFERVVPCDKRQKAIDSYCFDKDGCGGYLWHVFSFEILDYIELDKAVETFDNLPKQDAVLLMNWGDIDGITSCRLKNISAIKAKYLDLLSDVILTDEKFEWLYVKTHETGMCGPYFHWVQGA